MRQERSDRERREQADEGDRVHVVSDATGTLIDDDFVEFCAGPRDRDGDERAGSRDRDGDERAG